MNLPLNRRCVDRRPRDDTGVGRPQASRTVHCGRGRAEPYFDGVEHPSVVGADAIDLVHEEDRRHAQPAECAVEDERLGLDAFYG